MSLFSSKLRSNYTICLFGYLFLLLNFFTFKSPILGCTAFLLYFIPIGQELGKKLFSKEKHISSLLGLLFALLEILIIGTFLYYIYKITALLSFLLLLLPLSTALALKKNTNPILKEENNIYKDLLKPLSLIVIFLDVFLLGYLFFHRTYELAASPWMQVTPLFFVLYTLSNIFLFFNYKNNTTLSKNNILTSVHFFLGISIAALIYPLGYGFDAFIHRATETWIQNNGFILPKPPYYIGQYVFVVFLSNITQIKIFFVDVFLVPILSAIFIPGIILSSTKKLFSDSNSMFLSSLAFWILPFLPFLSLHLTTPHNLVLLLTIILVFLNFLYTRKEISFLLPITLSLAAIVTHPLIGAPGFLFTLTIILIKKFENKKILKNFLSALYFFGICLLLPILFTLNGLRIGTNLPNITNPLKNFSNFLELFKRPYWYAANSPLRFEILYFCERLIIPAILLLALYGFLQYRKSNKSFTAWIFPITALGLFLDAYLLRSWIVFPDVVAYEQGDYPLRLIHTSILFLLPFALSGFISFFRWILSLRILPRHSKLSNNRSDHDVAVNTNQGIFINILISLFAITLTSTLYLSYPQRNVKVRFPGYNVTQADFDAVEWIHNQNTQYNYIVLSNQLVSAAALTNYSFTKYFETTQGPLFYYSLPTGGILYQYYGKMIYEGQKPEYMQEAMQIAGVQKAYFVVNSYWANSSKIIEEAKKSANSFKSIHNGTIWIFEYIKNS